MFTNLTNSFKAEDCYKIRLEKLAKEEQKVIDEAKTFYKNNKKDIDNTLSFIFNLIRKTAENGGSIVTTTIDVPDSMYLRIVQNELEDKNFKVTTNTARDVYTMCIEWNMGDE